MSAAVLPKQSALSWLWLSAALIVVDQASKWLAVASLPYQVQVAFVPGFWNWHLTHNTGAAFSFLANAGGWQHGFFIALATLISVVLAVALRRVAREDWRNAFPFALIIAGALGNLVDRLRFGYVVDFVEWHAADSYYWPVFNVADSCIVVGAVLMVWFSLHHKDKAD
jgi:signal peptidase II